MSTEIQASEFKARCLALLDEVAAKRTVLIVTKHGRAVAKVVPVDEPAPLSGSVTVLDDDDEALFSTGEDWSLG